MTDKDYCDCIQWIAENDESAAMDWREIEYLVTVCMVADLFGETPKSVAQSVIAVRRASEATK